VLLVDDVQFLVGKESTQDEFPHVQRAARNHEQIVLTAGHKPREISGIADRLRTRFARGLLADIESPDLEVRIAILALGQFAWDAGLTAPLSSLRRPPFQAAFRAVHPVSLERAARLSAAEQELRWRCGRCGGSGNDGPPLVPRALLRRSGAGRRRRIVEKPCPS
jgi:hypothetical protein